MATPKAYSTINTILKAGASVSALEKMCKIKSYPDLGGAPETVESTDLEDRYQTFVEGVQSMDAMEFTCNYNPDDYETVEDLENTELVYQLEMGTSGSQGRFRWNGTHSVRVTGGDVNAVREMVITVVPSSAVSVLAAPNPTPSVTLSSSVASISVSGNTTLTATVVPNGSTVSWASANSSVATVTSSGYVTGVASGSTTITASIKVDGTNYDASCAVVVS